MRVSDFAEGINKYYQQKTFDNCSQFYQELIDHFNLPITPGRLNFEVTQYMIKYCPGITTSYEPTSNDEVIRLMTHDAAGHLRDETSCGYNFNLRRKDLARKHEPAIREYLDTFDCSHDVLCVSFLKEEMREKGKATRSIAVFQVHVWMIFQKTMRWMYKFLEEGVHPFAYQASIDSKYFTHKLDAFDFEFEHTFSCDMKKQDSRMNTIFIEWFENFICHSTNFPQELQSNLFWIHNQCFFNKKVIDLYGNILTFSNGEMSGFPGTIMYNSFYSLWVFLVSQVCSQLRTRVDYDRKFIPLCILGDDTIFQHADFQAYQDTMTILNHELYVEEGKLQNQLTFLSLKFHRNDAVVSAYYANLDKMFASLRYMKGFQEYFQKLASFHQSLVFAPPGSQESEWLHKLDEVLRTYAKLYKHELTPVLNSYRPIQFWRKHKSDYSFNLDGW